MLVKTQCKGREYTGVEVGAGNVRRYFPKQILAIEITLDHLQIQCDLAPGFWNGSPEISDPRLSAWLESKNFHGIRGQGPIALAMIPSGKSSFRLEVVGINAHARHKPAARPFNPA
jgi:hypothetical protein